MVSREVKSPHLRSWLTCGAGAYDVFFMSCGCAQNFNLRFTPKVSRLFILQTKQGIYQSINDVVEGLIFFIGIGIE